MSPRLRLANQYKCTRCLFSRQLSIASISSTSANASAPLHNSAQPRGITRSFHRLSKRSYTNATSHTTPPSTPPSGYTSLPHRGLILLSGPDAAHLLHGITTSSVRTPPSTPSPNASHTPTAGPRLLLRLSKRPRPHPLRRLHLPYPSIHSIRPLAQLKHPSSSQLEPAYLIETSTSRIPALLAHLKRYKLRSKASMRALGPDELLIYSVWDSESRWTAHGASADTAPPFYQNGQAVVGLTDTRAPGMGTRLILPPSTTPASLPTSSSSSSSLSSSMSSLQEAPQSAYHIRRLLRGVPEGPLEIPPAAALPHESNMDLMGGVDFKKGCYVGQELTIRTQHTGVVRKRVVPVMLYRSTSTTGEGREEEEEGSDTAIGHAPMKLAYEGGDLAEHVAPGASIHPLSTGRSAGRFLDGIGNVGLGLCRVEKMTDLVLTAEGSAYESGDEFGFRVSDLLVGGRAAAGDEEGGGRGGGDTATSEGTEKREGKESKEMGDIRIKAFVPDWIRNQIKVRDPQRRIG